MGTDHQWPRISNHWKPVLEKFQPLEINELQLFFGVAIEGQRYIGGEKLFTKW